LQALFFRHLFLLGIVAFWLPKLAGILLQTNAMDQPRLGDDALLLLWRGEQVNVSGLVASMSPIDKNSPRALRDITDLCPPTDSYELSRKQNWCERTSVGFARPHFVMGANLIASGVLATGLDLKWSFAIYETIILTLATLGFSYLLLRAVGASGAGVGLMLLALASVPSAQGLHQFIPSFLVMGLSMGLWATLIGCRTWKGTIPALIGFPVLAWFHPISLLFAGGGILIFFFENRNILNAKKLVQAIIVVTTLLATILALSEVVRDVLLTELTQNFWSNFWLNLDSTPGFFTTFGMQNPGLAALLILSAIFWKRSVNAQVAIIGTALLVLMVLSFLHVTSSYRYTFPLDLFARFFTCFLILSAGVAGNLILSFDKKEKKFRRFVLAAVVFSAATASAPSWINSSLLNVNHRQNIVNRADIQRGLAELREDSVIAYGEIDISLPAILLSGGHNKGAIPALGLEEPRLIKAIKDRRPDAVVVPLFPSLNTLAAVRSRNLEARQFGIIGEYNDRVFITSRNLSIVSLSLKLSNTSGTAQTIGPIFIRGSRQSGRGRDIVLSSGKEEWFHFDFPLVADVRQIQLTLPEASVWVKGVLINEEPKGLVNWPWSIGAQVAWHYRNAGPKIGRTLDFTVESLLKRWSVPHALGDTVRFNAPVVSDKGGIVFMKTNLQEGN